MAGLASAAISLGKSAFPSIYATTVVNTRLKRLRRVVVDRVIILDEYARHRSKGPARLKPTARPTADVVK
jgi:hypothetical protein